MLHRHAIDTHTYLLSHISYIYKPHIYIGYLHNCSKCWISTELDKSVDIYTAAACVGGGGDVIHCNVLSLCTGVAMNLALDHLGCRFL